MDEQESEVRPSSDGARPTGTENLPGPGQLQFPAEGESKPSIQPENPERLVPQIPPELQPDKDGNPPAITPELIRKLRGKYFTVKHPRLTDCGHLLDMVNFPKRNCHTCLFNWFNSHAQLVELAHEFYTKHGRKALAAMRGDKFVKAFLMFMSTIAHFQKEAAEGKIDVNPLSNGRH